MPNHEFVFTPLGDPPTLSNIIPGFIFICVMLIIGYVILYFCSAPEIRAINSIIYGIFFILVVYSLIQTKYIKVIRIDPVQHQLSYHYITLTGEVGVVNINLLTAKYSCKFHKTRSYAGYTLILRDKDSQLEIQESRRGSKRSKNVLSPREMYRLDTIIQQIRDSATTLSTH